MKKNIGRADRMLRILAAVVVGVLYLTDAVSGIPLAIIALLLIGTGLIGFCPLYKVVKITTVPAEQATHKGTAHE